MSFGGHSSTHCNHPQFEIFQGFLLSKWNELLSLTCQGAPEPPLLTDPALLREPPSLSALPSGACPSHPLPGSAAALGPIPPALVLTCTSISALWLTGHLPI